MLKADDYRLRDISYLLEFGEFDLARTKLAVLQKESPGDPLLRDFETKLATAPQGSVDPYAHLSHKISYADRNELSSFAADHRGWPGVCLKLGAVLSILGVAWGKGLIIVPALLRYGWNHQLVLVTRHKMPGSFGVRRYITNEYNVTAGQLFLENSIFLLVGPALLIAAMVGFILAKQREAVQ